MKIKYLIICLLSCFLLSGCEECNTEYVPKEQPHLYWKDIEVEIVDIDKRHWFGGTHWYEVQLTVYSEEYGLTEKFYYKTSGMFMPSQWDYNKGGKVKAELFSWKMDSTGEVVKREIHKIY